MLLKRKQKVGQAQYATSAEFCRIFENEMKPLYLLAFLLTARHAQAERCFVGGLEDSGKGNSIFRDWARAWARRMIIKNAIRIMSPVSGRGFGACESWDPDGKQSDASLAIDAVVQLPTLERFEFVMSVLERYPVHECALLLGCAPQEIVAARVDALMHLTLRRPSLQSIADLEVTRPLNFLGQTPTAISA